jgi:serine/threonine-protein kinase
VSALLGTLLNERYRLDAQIGSGGMSVVYRALDTVLERRVAIKLMHREVASDSAQLERFRREARAVAQLSHPNIVGVIDAGEEEESGRPFIVFECVEGETLKQRIRRLGSLPVGEATAYAIEIARALGAAHAAHIVHRDVKPQNVLIDEEGRAKVTDFGIARTLEEEGLTADGRVLGTTDYVSPEQATGNPVTGQSDIYSLGIVLYEMLVGDVPYHGQNQVAVAMKHVREEVPDVQALRPEASAVLAAVVDRATDKDLVRRYRSAESLIADLEEALAVQAAHGSGAGGTAVLRTLPERTRRRVPIRVRHSLPVLGGLLALAVAAVAVVAVVLSQHAQSGTGARQPSTVAASPRVREISLGQRAAQAFDPIGGDGEHDSKAVAVLDGDKTSTWTTEHYEDGDLGKAGVGIWVATPNASPRRVSQLVLDTPTPGFVARVWAADAPVPKSAPGGAHSGWTAVSPSTTVHAAQQSFALHDPGRGYVYYLVWITKLPPHASQAAISEISLLGPNGA